MIRIKNYLIALVVFSTSCNKYSDEVKLALKLAGQNEKELIKVFDTYNEPKDSLKLKAAYFLIGNMSNKSYHLYNKTQEKLIQTLKKPSNRGEIKGDEKINLKNDSTITSMWTKLNTKYGNLKSKKLFDLETITSDVLIDNIEHGFKVWDEVPWSKKYTFDEFCNYVLPYRNYYDTPEIWRNDVYDKFKWVKDSIKDDDFIKATQLINDSINWFRWHKVFYNYSNIPVSDIFKGKYGSCRNHSSLKLAVLRSLGIPCKQLFAPGATSWVAIPDKNKKFLDWEFKSPPNINAKYVTEKRKAKYSKIYEVSYRMQPDYFNSDDKSTIPLQFLNRHSKDVTSEHTYTSNIKISIDNNKNHKYVYLCEYDNFKKGWNAVDWSIINGENAYFTQVGIKKIYNPMFFEKGKYFSAGSPFYLLKDGKKIILKASNINKEVKIFRKNELNYNENAHASLMLNTYFEGSNNSNFRNAKTLYKIKDIPQKLEEIKIKPVQFRYIRYVSGDGIPMSPEYQNEAHLAEIHFLNDKGQKLNGINLNTNNKSNVNNLYDEDIRTNFDCNEKCWVGLDLGRPTKIGGFRYLFRNSFNTIEKGDDYELFYWNENKWVSLGIKEAKNNYIEFICPENSVLWLRDRTKGSDEMIFFVDDNGKQIWG